MTAIDWALYTEQAVGKGAPALADVINRPLREILTLSGINPDGAFPGFVVQGGPIVGALTGNASTATALSSIRTFAITGDVAGNASADLSTGVSISVALAAGVVTNTSVANAAAIAYGKLALAASILGTDIAPSANIPDSKLAQLTTANKVANSATTATSANMALTIVSRDGAGGFSAGAITATSVSGDGSALTSLTAGAIATGTLGVARLSGTYAGITGVGALAAGVWNATVIGPTYGGTGQVAIAIGDLLFGAGSNTWTRLGGNASTTRKFLAQTGDGTNPTAPTWGTLTAADIGVGTFPTGTFVYQGAVNGITGMALGVNATGSNVVASDVTIAAPVSTGTATPATLHFQAGHVGSSGATLQTLEDVLTLTDRAAIFPRGMTLTGAPGVLGNQTGYGPSWIYASRDVGIVLTPGAASLYADIVLENSIDPTNPGTNPHVPAYAGTIVMIVVKGSIDAEFVGDLYSLGKLHASGFNVGGQKADIHNPSPPAGTDGIDLSGTITNLTVMKGIVTAAS